MKMMMTANLLLELLAVAESLRAIIVADCPNTNKTDAVNYANDWEVQEFIQHFHG